MGTHTLQGLELAAAAKALGTTRPALLKQLRTLGVIYHNSPLPQSQYITAGYFTVETKGFSNDHGINRQYSKTLVTGTGMSWLAGLINDNDGNEQSAA